jgi:hypothetical protein
LTYPAIQGIVVGQDVIRRADSVIHHVVVRVGFQDSNPEPHTFPHPPDVVGVLEIAVVERRLVCGVGRWQFDVT